MWDSLNNKAMAVRFQHLSVLVQHLIIQFCCTTVFWMLITRISGLPSFTLFL